MSFSRPRALCFTCPVESSCPLPSCPSQKNARKYCCSIPELMHFLKLLVALDKSCSVAVEAPAAAEKSDRLAELPTHWRRYAPVGDPLEETHWRPGEPPRARRSRFQVPRASLLPDRCENALRFVTSPMAGGVQNQGNREIFGGLLQCSSSDVRSRSW